MGVPGATTYRLLLFTVTPLGRLVEGLIGQQLIDSLMNLTEPSQNRKLAPPGWKLDAAATNVSDPPPTFPIVPVLGSFRNGLMGYIVQKLVSPKLPEHHQFQQT